MKKFGILTYHNANNYGAALQAYALQKFLKDHFGDDQVEVIDYQCAGVRRQRSFLIYFMNKDLSVELFIIWPHPDGSVRSIISVVKI